jgi:uncharacterized SAM-binding protein YcdF (DUF218 family)
MGFFLKKIITAFLVPPGFFVSILICAGIYCLWKKQRIAAGMQIVTALMIWVFSTVPFSDFLMKGLEAEYRIPHLLQCDVILLPGGGSLAEAPEFSGKGHPGSESMMRITAAYRIFRKTHAPILVSGGPVYGGTSDAVIFARILTDMGVPPEKIIQENESRDTSENALFTAKIIRKKRFRNPVLVTSGFHIKRAMLLFRKAGITAAPFPAGYNYSFSSSYSWADFLPLSMNGSSLAIKEYLGLLFYTIF